jgi:hypothetical protein
MSASDVFQIVTHPASPGVCRVCGVAYGVRRMVDTGLTGDFCNRQHWNQHTQQVETDYDINLAGTIYFCESCVTNMGELIGMLDVPKAKKILEENAELGDALELAKAKILGMEQIINGYHDLGFDDRIIDSVPSVSSSPVFDEHLRDSGSIPESGESSPTEGTGEVSQSLQGTDFGESQTDQLEFGGGESGDISLVDSDESRESGDDSTNAQNIGF